MGSVCVYFVFILKMGEMLGVGGVRVLVGLFEERRNQYTRAVFR